MDLGCRIAGRYLQKCRKMWFEMWWDGGLLYSQKFGSWLSTQLEDVTVEDDF